MTFTANIAALLQSPVSVAKQVNAKPMANIAALLKAKSKGNHCHEPAGSPKGGQFCANERMFTGTYTATDKNGKPKKFKFKVKAKDSYEAGDKVKEQAKGKWGDLVFPVIRFDNKSRRRLSGAGEHAIDNAGPEEKVDLLDLLGKNNVTTDNSVRLHYKSYVDSNSPLLKIRIQKVFNKERKRILKALFDKGRPSEERINAVLDTITKGDLMELEGVLAPTLEATAIDGGRQGISEVPAKKANLMDLLHKADEVIDFVTEFAVEYAKRHSAALVGRGTNDDYSIPRVTRKWLKEDIALAVEDGMTQQQLATMIQEHYAFSPGRSETIARTELANAYVRGNVAGWKATGVVVAKEWITFPDCCDRCDEMNGEVVRLDSDFSAGVPGPTLHPNCKCDLKPVLADEYT